MWCVSTAGQASHTARRGVSGPPVAPASRMELFSGPRQPRSQHQRPWLVALLVLLLAHGWQGAGARTGRMQLDRCGFMPTSRASDSLNFFVIGDWGEAGGPGQRQVASLMSRLSTCYSPSFMLSTGDNFYMSGLKGPDDPYFKQTFTDVYSGPGLNVPWLAVLGNHDYGEKLTDASGWRSRVRSCSPEVVKQIAAGLNASNSRSPGPKGPGPLLKCPAGCCYGAHWQADLAAADPRWVGARQGAWSKVFAGGQLELFFLDTSPQVPAYHQKPWGDPHMEGSVGTRDPDADRAALVALLEASRAPWKIVVGHHPPRSYGEHCFWSNNGECKHMRWIKRVLKDHKVAVYMSGHEHDLQLIKDPEGGSDPVTYVISGAGANAVPGEFGGAGPWSLLSWVWHLMHPIRRAHDARFLADQLGFVAVSLAPKGDLTLHFWTISEKQGGSGPSSPAYSFTVKKPDW